MTRTESAPQGADLPSLEHAPTGQGLEALHLAFVRQDPAGEETWVLTDLSCTLAPGRPTLLVGPTGAGKSTLLHLLAGLYRPTRGEVFADGQPISRFTAPHRDHWRRQVGLALQHPLLLPDLTVLENLFLPLVPRSPPNTWRERALSSLEALDSVALAPRRADALSGGERQRVGLARALVSSPRFLLLDEPTAHQDARGVERVVALYLRFLKAGGVGVIATHDERLLKAIPDRTLLTLSGGRLTEER